MKNEQAATILNEIGDYLDMDSVPFKPFAYRKAAQVIESMDEDIHDIYVRDGLKGLQAIPGVGMAIAKKLEEYLSTGTIKYWEDLKIKTPVRLSELLAVEGLGPRRAKILFDRLGIRTVKDLEKNALAGKVRDLEGFGEQSEKNILQSIGFLKRDKGRFAIGEILPIARKIQTFLGKLEKVKRISIAGSLRRGRETIGDVDLLAVATDIDSVMVAFTTMSGVEKIWGKGPTKSSVRLKEGFDVDLRIVPENAYGAALQYFTGSKNHNIKLRTIAIGHGLKLNEYGLFKGQEMIATRQEEDIYKTLGLSWVPPELREEGEEIERAKEGKLPVLVELKDIKGDLHCHSNWNGGKNSVKEIAESAKALGYEYIGIADHTKMLTIERGLDEELLLKRNLDIDRFNRKETGVRILKGCEANILDDGSIDIADEVLGQMDFVIAGVHSHFKMDEAGMTARIGKAMENPHVDIISHPTGRLIKQRDAYAVNMDILFEHAKETGTILEVNSFPDRLDLAATHIRMAVDRGIPLVINTDTHDAIHMRLMEYGVQQARRGWAAKSNIINTYPLREMLGFLKKG